MTKPTKAEMLLAQKSVLRRIILEFPVHDESWQCESCYANEAEPHKHDCLVAEAARLSLELAPELRDEIGSRRWPRWEGDQ